MASVCVHTIVRNGEDFIEQVICAVLPYADRVLISVDENSTDRTRAIVHGMKYAYPQIMIDTFENKFPLTDIVKARNRQIERTTEDWIWVVDSDEYYPKDVIEKIKLSEEFDVYTLQCWAVWDEKRIHKSSSRPHIARIFKNDGRRWEGRFGKEHFTKEGDRVKNLPLRYIHFTHIKKDKWRRELGMNRVADAKFLSPMPLDIIHKIKNL